MKWKKWDLSSEGFLRIVPFAVAIASIHHPGFLQAERVQCVSQQRGDLFLNFLQFRTVEVTALEKWQGDFENASLAGFEFKLLAALRCRATR